MTKENPSTIESASTQLGSGAVSVGGNVGGNIVIGDHVIIAHEGATINVGSEVLAKHSQSVSEGLRFLALIFADSEIHRSEIHDIAIIYQTQFSLLQQQIDVLVAYKLLHDQLHMLQFHCYEPILYNASRFPNDPYVIYELEGYELSLSNIAGELHSIVEVGNLPPAHVTWVGEISDIGSLLMGAIKNLDNLALYEVIRRFHRILSMQLGRIDNYLNATARLLQLDKLADSIREIYEQLPEHTREHKQSNLIWEGVNSLQALSKALALLLDTHESWQDIDIELRRIGAPFVAMDLRRIRHVVFMPDPVQETSLTAESLLDIKYSWPLIEERILALAKTNTSIPFVRLREYHIKMCEVMGTGSPTDIVRQFRYLHHQAAFCFCCVDKQVKVLCEELWRIGAPLDNLARMLE